MGAMGAVYRRALPSLRRRYLPCSSSSNAYIVRYKVAVSRLHVHVQCQGLHPAGHSVFQEMYQSHIHSPERSPLGCGTLRPKLTGTINSSRRSRWPVSIRQATYQYPISYRWLEHSFRVHHCGQTQDCGFMGYHCPSTAGDWANRRVSLLTSTARNSALVGSTPILLAR